MFDYGFAIIVLEGKNMERLTRKTVFVCGNCMCVCVWRATVPLVFRSVLFDSIDERKLNALPLVQSFSQLKIDAKHVYAVCADAKREKKRRKKRNYVNTKINRFSFRFVRECFCGYFICFCFCHFLVHILIVWRLQSLEILVQKHNRWRWGRALVVWGLGQRRIYRKCTTNWRNIYIGLCRVPTVFEKY